MRTVTYAHRGGLPLQADIFHVVDGGPLLVFCHGGGWISGGRQDYLQEAQWWAEQGINGACVSYRLAPENPFPAAIADLQDFIIYARNQNYDKIAAFGNSAGGHIAAMLALSDDYFGPDINATRFKVDAAVCVCPITDITHPRKTQFPVGWPFVEQFVGSLDADAPILRAASPVHHVSPEDAPVLLIHGEEDDIVPADQSRKLFDALQAAGVLSELHLFPFEMHSFTWEAWQDIRGLALGWLPQALASKGALL